jgi:CheY-like chemotaxis protein
VRFDENAADPPAWLDATRFQQIVWNLMTNAIKFSQEGGRIDVELERRGDLLMLSVRDFGHGIEADFLAHLFDRFTQSDSPDNRRHQGLGLGLAIVKDLAELHDGRVDAASAGLGQGAVLCVTLKVVAAEPNPSEPMDEAPAAAPAMLSENALSGLDVLVVEDNVDAGETLRVVLTSGGAVVRVATDAKAALAALEERWPTVLLSDIGLPGLDGYELIRRVRRIEQAEQRPELFAVALTAFARPQDQARALEAGFDEHIKKPLAPMHLTQVIAHRRRGA